MKRERMKKALVPVGIMLLAVAVFVMIVLDLTKEQFKQSTKSTVAMGTVVTEKLYGKKTDESVFDDIEKTITELENEISWRISGSAVDTLNKSGAVVCSDRLKNALSLCGEVYASSGGAFDVTVGKVTSLWKIGEEDAAVPDEKALKKALSFVDGGKLKINGSSATVAEGQFVDLGSVGKGLACDEIRKTLEEKDIYGAVVSVGGSVLLYGKNPTSDSWSVAVRDPRGDSSSYMGTLSLKSGVVSTSGDYERVLTVGDRKYHHILDPKTGYPADSGLISVTVVCDSGILSDALSTAAFVKGLKGGAELLESFGAEGVFIDKDKKVYVTDGLSDKFTLNGDGYELAEASE
ncbi:MAG: FAD:protein FMN transferase [Acutalibacteraceae bacterium]